MPAIVTITNTTIGNAQLNFDGGYFSFHFKNCLIASSVLGFQGFPRKHITMRNCNFSNFSSKTEKEAKRTSSLLMRFTYSIVQFHNCQLDGLQNKRTYRSFIYSKSSNVTMINVTVINNVGSWMMFDDCIAFFDCEKSNITMMNVTVSNNVGCFIDIDRCNVQLTHSHFMDNVFLSISDEDAFRGSNVSISNSFFGNNKGPIVNVKQSKLRIDNSQFLNNTSEYGIAIEIWTLGDALVTNSTFTGNQGVDGAALTAVRSHVVTTDCLFRGNTAKERGGAISVIEGEYQDHGSLFIDNAAGVAGKCQILYRRNFKFLIESQCLNCSVQKFKLRTKLQILVYSCNTTLRLIVRQTTKSLPKSTKVVSSNF